MLTGICISSYPKNGRKMFVFKVTGTDDEIDEYLTLQKKRFPSGSWTDSDGNALYWTSSPSGKNIKLLVTTNGNIVEDTTDLDLQAAGQARYDHTYGTVLNGLKQASGVTRTVAQPTPEKTPLDN